MTKSISHQDQQNIWEKEHAEPFSLLQMDSEEGSSGVVKFLDWLKDKKIDFRSLKAIELGCGKGRNVIWLAKQGFHSTGIDFSRIAVDEAKKRATRVGVEKQTEFYYHDATTFWNFPDNSFDIVIDCFATTDIEDAKGRMFAASEMVRILKPGGYLLAYLLSPQDEYHAQTILKSPATEENAFIHPKTGKFEKTFDLEEIKEMYKGVKLIEHERVAKVATFFEKKYNCLHHWCVFQK